MKKLLAILTAAVLAGCSSTPQPEIKWVTNFQVDEFTDKSTCTVTTGSLYVGKLSYTYNNHFYPFVENKDGEVRVGVMSGGNVKIPVGDIQIRVDSNPAWTITTAETPLDYVPEATKSTMSQYTKGMTEQQQKLAETTYQATMETAVRTMSPYTAATGEKALEIIKQMKGGANLKYRVIGLNQAGSSVGEFKLDDSFVKGLIKCGVEA